MSYSKPIHQIFINPLSSSVRIEEKVFFLLRLGILGCFVGHGSWGIITKSGWLPFFDVFYIPNETAYFLMPIIGSMDILIGLVCFLFPNRALLTWAAFWAVFTALLRPSAGMGMSEFFERAGNYGVPISFLVLYGFAQTKKDGTDILKPKFDIDLSTLKKFEWVLRLSLASLLAGHGGIAFFKLSPNFLTHFSALGFDLNFSQLKLFGLFEIALGLLVLVKPKLPGLLFFILFYKLFTELLHPYAGQPIDILETIERFGDYVIPAILILIYPLLNKKKD